MPRRSRINLAGVPQHIIQRGNNRVSTFMADADYRFYLECLDDAARKYGCRIYAYALMTNHVHLLMEASAPDSISRAMQHVGRRFVQYINYKYGRSGTLWEGRFKATLVQTEEYFLRCCRYIECNPVRAGLVADPADYRWSSHRARACGEQAQLLAGHDQFQRLGRTDVERQHRYRELFGAELDSIALSEIRSTVNRGWPLGSEQFKDEVERALACAARPPKRGRPARQKSSLNIGSLREKSL